MNAQRVFDIDSVKEIILSYCLPAFTIVTKDMIDKKIRLSLFDASNRINCRTSSYFQRI